MQLGIALTFRCNAACTHCSTSCGPHRTESLSQMEIFRLIDEAALIDDGEPLRIDLTGGEPFLDFELLKLVVAHAAGRGAQVSCVTNASWAHADDKAAEKIGILKAIGLTALAVSVSRFHAQFIPLSRVQRVLEAANALGLKTELKGAVTRADLALGGAQEQWKRRLKADLINMFPVLPHLRAGASLDDSDYCREPGLPLQVCPAEVVCVEPDGNAYSCANPGLSTGFLALGSIRSDSLEQIQQRFRARAKQKILREKGPAWFAMAAVAHGLGSRLRPAYAGPCDLCLHIAMEPELRLLADRMASAIDQSDTSAGLPQFNATPVLEPFQLTAESTPHSLKEYHDGYC